MPVLAKSDLQSYLQRPRKVWLEHHRPDLIPPANAFLDRRIIDGKFVGEKARDELGTGYLWPPGMDDKAAAAHAKGLLAENPGLPASEVPVVFEGLYEQGRATEEDHAQAHGKSQSGS
jgi:hypothetical protein